MKKFIAINNDSDDNEASVLCFIEANDENHATVIYEQEERDNYLQDEENDPKDIESFVSQSMENLEIHEVTNLATLGSESENEDVEKPQVTQNEIKALITERGLTIQKVIEAVIELNGMIGVGIISLGDELKNMTYNKSHNNSWRSKK